MYKTNYKPEDIIFKEGDDPTACFLIYRGKVKVIKNKMLVLKKEVSHFRDWLLFCGEGFSHLCTAVATVVAEKKHGLICSAQIHLPAIAGKKSCL